MTSLTAVAALSIVAALGASGLAWNLWRQERERAVARVAALASALRDESSDQSAGDVAASLATFESEREEPVHTGPRRAGSIAAAIGLIVVAAIWLALPGGRRGESTSLTQHQAPATLDLLSLGDSRDGAFLVVSGVVRARTVALADVNAVVVGFDADGAIAARGDAALEQSEGVTPDAGNMSSHEATFRVVLDGRPPIARYRVSFRTNGETLHHIDRRAEPPL